MESTSGDWRDKAECRKKDPDLFFPTGEKSEADQEQIKRAKAVCAECLSRIACLEYAIANNEDFGIWGGTSETERRSARRRQARQRHWNKG